MPLVHNISETFSVRIRKRQHSRYNKYDHLLTTSRQRHTISMTNLTEYIKTISRYAQLNLSHIDILYLHILPLLGSARPINTVFDKKSVNPKFISMVVITLHVICTFELTFQMADKIQSTFHELVQRVLQPLLIPHFLELKPCQQTKK